MIGTKGIEGAFGPCSTFPQLRQSPPLLHFLVLISTEENFLFTCGRPREYTLLPLHVQLRHLCSRKGPVLLQELFRWSSRWSVRLAFGRHQQRVQLRLHSQRVEEVLLQHLC